METKSREVIRMGRVKKETGLSQSTIHRRAFDPDDEFPAAIYLSPGCKGWYLDELIAWRDGCPRSVDKANVTLEAA